MRRAARLCIAGIALAGLVWPVRASTTGHLQLYQLVRSLQLVQDRIAGGDHATLPMQAKLLEIIDARLKDAKAQDLESPENFRALLVYGMSGGNPRTLKASSARMTLDAGQRALMNGVLAYLGGRPAEATEALEAMDPMTMPASLGAFVALIKGSLLGAEKPQQALVLLDQARLLSPGTLVEEAALRRSVGIAITVGDADRFLLASTQYVERFLHSPYASQFADSFVAGVVAMNQAISRARITDITAMMDGERERIIYLRIARSAAIGGLSELSAFAADKARSDHPASLPDDPRGQLYSVLSAVTSGAIPEIKQALRRIDRSQLSASDRKLLDAAQIVAQEVIAPPPVFVAKAQPLPLSQNDAASEPSAGPSKAQTIVDDSGLPVVEGILPQTTSAQPDKTQPPPNLTPSGQKTIEADLPVVPASAAPASSNDPTAAAIARTKRKLDMIDQLLGASPQ